MANEEHLAILRRGVETWNAWRVGKSQVRPDLTHAYLAYATLNGANLAHAKLGGANLAHANLDGADLTYVLLARADLNGASLYGACLARADLARANLVDANLARASLDGANLDGASLLNANLARASLDGANLDGALLLGTIFAAVDLTGCKRLETCRHIGPSTIDHHTLQRSGPLPLAFLRGVGLPDTLIDYLPSLLNQPIQRYSCFISYSSRDQAFAERLHADLQNKGVRCWFAPHDLPIGAKTWDAIDEAIRLRDKVLLILSEHAIASDWVEDEVTKAFAEERRRDQLVLFPVRLDDAVLTTAEPWAGKLRDNRNIGDFRRWKEHNTYVKALDRLLRDLRVERA